MTCSHPKCINADVDLTALPADTRDVVKCPLCATEYTRTSKWKPRKQLGLFQ